MKTVSSLSTLDKVKEGCALLAQVLLLIAIVSVAQIVLWHVIRSQYSNGQPFPVIGFADSFAPIATLFSGFAFAGVIWAILLQRKELQMQRLDLELTREELAKSAKAQDMTVRLMKADRNSREYERARAATPVLVPISFRDADHRTTTRLSITNLGKSIFLPEIDFKGDKFLNATNFVYDLPSVVPKDATMHFTIHAWPPSLPAEVNIGFSLFCYDITGREREVKFFGKFAIGATLSQTAIDFPTKQDEEDNVMEIPSL